MLLEVENLTVRYGRSRRAQNAVDGVSLRIAVGETVGLVGESGSGKSSLCKAILGLVPPSAGTIRLGGRDITRGRRRDFHEIQAVFQDPYGSFNPNRTIGSALLEPLLRSSGMSRDQKRDRVVQMLQRVGLDEDVLARYPREFSGGQRQRISIVRALVPAPRLVVCDEVVSALDLSVQAQVLNLLGELQREAGFAYLFVTHDLAVVDHVSSRVLVLKDGRVVEEGDTGTVLERPEHPYTRMLMASSLVADPAEAARRRLARVLRRSEGYEPAGDVP